LLSVCRRIGPDATVAYVLPRLQALFTFGASGTSKDNLEMWLNNPTNTGRPDNAGISNNEVIMEAAALGHGEDHIKASKLKAQMDTSYIFSLL
jgi:hypothetical protein